MDDEILIEIEVQEELILKKELTKAVAKHQDDLVVWLTDQIAEKEIKHA